MRLLRVGWWFPMVTVLLVPGLCNGADGVGEKVGRLFAKYQKPGSPGCAVAVIKNGKIVHQQSYGLANLEYDIPITTKSVFQVASISKQFAAFAILLLEQEGKLSLDDEIQKHLPGMPDFGNPITIRHLLYHTSGLRGEWNLLELAGWGREDVITQRTLVDLLERQRELNFEPGKKYLYCSTNYTLLAEIVARASEIPFAEFAKQRIFDPLSMKNTHFHDDPKMIVPNRVYSYEPAGKGGYKIAQLNHGSVGARNLYRSDRDRATDSSYATAARTRYWSRRPSSTSSPPPTATSNSPSNAIRKAGWQDCRSIPAE